MRSTLLAVLAIVGGALTYSQAAGATTTSGDTFSFRQNRLYPFNWADLAWDIAFEPAPPLPPDPGEAGKATLEGIDSDGDGQRDDIQRYIAFTFPNSARVRAAAAAIAKALQDSLLIGTDQVAAMRTARNINRAMQCFWFVREEDTFEEVREGDRLLTELRAEVLNTAERSRAHLAYDAQLAGGIFMLLPESAWKSQCAFDPDALPN